jgi:type IV fimbrial biogenesis protein FimT
MTLVSQSVRNGAETRRRGVPFIGLLLPFVGRARPQIGPFIVKNKPFVLNRAFGFTLVEIMITVVIASILMGLAAPSFVNFVKNNRLSSQANGLMADLAFARSEAVKRGANITICRASDPFAACTGSAGPWSTGWIVIDGAGQVLRLHEALDGQNTLTGTGTLADQTAYTGTGLITLGAAQSFSLCDDRLASYGRLIQISITGRAAIAKDSAGHLIPPASCT